MAREVLVLDKINAGYGEFHVLFDVSLKVHEGEIVALVGPNGAGKTTTLRTIMGMTTLYSGKVLLNGNDVTKIPTHKRIELGITMVPEGRRIFKTLTVYENLLAGALTKKAQQRFQENLELVFNFFPKLRGGGTR